MVQVKRELSNINFNLKEIHKLNIPFLEYSPIKNYCPKCPPYSIGIFPNCNCIYCGVLDRGFCNYCPQNSYGKYGECICNGHATYVKEFNSCYECPENRY